jgi:hypothetical protein
MALAARGVGHRYPPPLPAPPPPPPTRNRSLALDFAARARRHASALFDDPSPPAFVGFALLALFFISEDIEKCVIFGSTALAMAAIVFPTPPPERSKLRDAFRRLVAGDNCHTPLVDRFLDVIDGLSSFFAPRTLATLRVEIVTLLSDVVGLFGHLAPQFERRYDAITAGQKPTILRALRFGWGGGG